MTIEHEEKRTSIRKKLLVSYLVFAILLVVVGLIAYGVSRRVFANLTRIQEELAMVAQKSVELEFDFQVQHTASHQYLQNILSAADRYREVGAEFENDLAAIKVASTDPHILDEIETIQTTHDHIMDLVLNEQAGIFPRYTAYMTNRQTALASLDDLQKAVTNVSQNSKVEHSAEHLVDRLNEVRIQILLYDPMAQMSMENPEMPMDSDEPMSVAGSESRPEMEHPTGQMDMSDSDSTMAKDPMPEAMNMDSPASDAESEQANEHLGAGDAEHRMRMDNIGDPRQTLATIFDDVDQTLANLAVTGPASDSASLLATSKMAHHQALSALDDADAYMGRMMMQLHPAETELDTRLDALQEYANTQMVQARMDAGRVIRTSVVVLVGSVLLFLVLSIAFAFRFARQIARPLVNLAGVADQVSMGELDVSIDVATNDEVQDLADALNRLVASYKYMVRRQQV